MNRKFYGLFIKRLYKWLFLLCCLIGMLIPLIHVSKSYIRNIVEQNLTWDIQESIDMMEHDFNKAHQMMNILSSEEPFQKLIKNKGEIPVDQYVYLSRLQTKLSQLSIIFDLDMMSYLVFRDTPVFISNRGCTDNYAKLMPFPLEFAEEGAKAWHDSLFDNTSSYQILPNLEFINPDFTYSGTGIVFIINSMHNSIPNDKCRLVTMIDCTQIRMTGFCISIIFLQARILPLLRGWGIYCWTENISSFLREAANCGNYEWSAECPIPSLNSTSRKLWWGGFLSISEPGCV